MFVHCLSPLSLLPKGISQSKKTLVHERKRATTLAHKSEAPDKDTLEHGHHEDRQGSVGPPSLSSRRRSSSPSPSLLLRCSGLKSWSQGSCRGGGLSLGVLQEWGQTLTGAPPVPHPGSSRLPSLPPEPTISKSYRPHLLNTSLLCHLPGEG